jgi:hypothetical protein
MMGYIASPVEGNYEPQVCRLISELVQAVSTIEFDVQFVRRPCVNNFSLKLKDIAAV